VEENNMPLRNGTGPLGEGPRTGRGLGLCGKSLVRDERSRRLGRGFGMGRCFGRGRFAGAAVEPIALSKEEQKKILEAEAVGLEAELNLIKEKLKDFE
jgi:hypothetical protein